ncbi:hypothetical protein [Kitasatospora sp. NPDC057223]|uniref:hypothetical protein n=1 Tax=Kitasatospora sp. NPDC057223 TaxID=3346055 RepID=UPI0036329224
MHRLLDDPGPEGFLADWYGPPDQAGTPGHAGASGDGPAVAPAVAAAAVDGLPPALAEWYTVTAGYGRPVLFNHRIAAPDELYEDDGLIAFCRDDFEAQEFGVAPGDGDPVVHQRWIGDAVAWEPHPEGLLLSQFLPALLLHESVEGARHAARASRLALARCAELLAPLHRLPGPELFTRQYAGEGLLAIAWPEPDEDTWTVHLAAREEASLRYTAAVPGVTFGPGEWCPEEGETGEGP